MLSLNGDKLDYLWDYIFTGPYSVPSEVTRAWNQDPPLELAESELIYGGEIRSWIKSGTRSVSMGGKVRQELLYKRFWRTGWEPWQDGVICRWLWNCLLWECDLALKEGLVGAHEWVPKGPKVGAIAEFLGENFSAVDVAGNVFYLDREVLLLAFMEKNSRRMRCLRPLVVVVLVQSQHLRLSL